LDLVDAQSLGDEPGRAEIHAAADHGRIVVRRHHHHGNARILRTHEHQAGESANPRHAEVQQDEIDVVGAVEQLGNVVEAAGLGDVLAPEQAGHRLAKRASEQRMVIGDHKPVRC